ncbi:hypothetical protein RND59_04135 [Vibrio ruber]|uniref:hypothetical protein n=1 Tax=Vibrio ruber TaxID=184755 RepID=UPI002893635E|nr:hypothetical protein [Vibrio ruber]WNJ96294.1 hypothetical protein RND59_04135 [Vibrio ruber]
MSEQSHCDTYPCCFATLEDGQNVPWEGFFTGPQVIRKDKLKQLAQHLLSLPPSNGNDCTFDMVHERASQLIIPFIADDSGQLPPSLILHSATSTTGGFEGDISEILSGGHAYDCATYLETRATIIATDGDFVLGRTSPWLDACRFLAFKKRGITALDIGYRDYYYLSQALLVAASAYKDGATIPFLDTLIAWYKSNPMPLVRVYTIDIEMQIFLCWLADEVDVDTIVVDSNSAEVATRWNQKGPLYPWVDWSDNLPFHHTTALEWYADEQIGSEVYQKLGIKLPTLPGYRIANSNVQASSFLEQLTKAVELLHTRHGIQTVCLKPSNAGDGARITTNIAVQDTEALKKLAATACRYEDDYLLEPHFYYKRLNTAEGSFKIALSAHIRYGHVLPSVTLQTMIGNVWVGNILIPKEHAHVIGLSELQYDKILNTMERIVQAFNRALVTGGVDFAIGTTDSVLEHDDNMLILQDPNLSSHGAEYLRAFCDQHEARIRDGYIAGTRVLKPTAQCTYDTLGQSLQDFADNTGTEVYIIAVVPGRWAMIACFGHSPQTVIESLSQCETWLSQAKLSTQSVIE